ncbi:MAG: ankyrin repeat domain-containing protein [Candidatus Brocadiaceae bacterium]
MRQAFCLGVVLVLTLALAAPVRADSAAVLLEKGIYTEETVGDLESAIEIYEQIIQDAQAERRYVAEAHYRLGVCHLKTGQSKEAIRVFEDVMRLYPDQERIAGAAETQLARLVEERGPRPRAFLPDPAVLMPPDTLLYVEAGSPGVQMERVLKMLEGTPLENPLAAMGGGRGGPSPRQVLAALMNPSMIKEFKKIEGAAFGLQGLKPQQSGMRGEAIMVLYPGESDALRGILLASLQMAGQPAEPVAGMTALNLRGGEGGACAFDDSAIILASSRELLQRAARQYTGETQEPSLLTASDTFADLSPEARREDAGTLWVNVPATLELVQQFGANQPDLHNRLQMVNDIVDLQRMKDVTVRHTIGERGTAFEAVVRFQDDHQSMAYNLMRTPGISLDDLQGVPADAVAVASLALGGAETPAAAQADQALQKATGLQIGREMFTNIRQVNLFVLPPAADSPESALARGVSPVAPRIGLAVASKDPARTAELMGKLLTTPAIIEGRGSEATPVQGMEGATAYSLGTVNGQPVSCYVAQAGEMTILTLGRETLGAATVAATGGESVLSAGPLQEALRALPSGTSKVLLANAGGLVELLRAQGASEQMPQEAQDALTELADALRQTVVRFQTIETRTGLTTQLAVEGLPPLSAVFPTLVRLQAMSRAPRREAVPPPTPVGVIRADEPITVDGDLGEWQGIPAMPAPFMEKDTSSVHLAWRQEGLYVAARVRDDSLTFNPEMPWAADSVELFVDKPFARADWHSGEAEQYVFSPTPGSPGRAHVLIAYGQNKGRESALPAAWKPLEDGYMMEALIPSEFLQPARMEAGSTLGFNFAVNDDGTPVEQFYFDKDRDEAYARPMYWGAIRLTGFGRQTHALLEAARTGDAATATELLAKGADPDARDASGDSALALAAAGGHAGVVATLLDGGAEADAAALRAAAEAGQASVVALLLRQPGVLEAEKAAAWDSFRAAAHNGHKEVVELFLAHDASPDARGELGRSALHWAAMFDHADVARALLDAGADLEIRDENNWSPLFFAAMGGSTETARLLLKRGAEVNYESIHGESPLSKAQQGGHHEVAELLKAHGAE